MKFQIGTVTSNADVTRTGLLKVAFKLQENETSQDEWVRYVSPYGNTHAAFVAIPGPGSTVMCAYSDSPLDPGNTLKGYFYMGSVMGVNPTEGRLLDEPQGPSMAPRRAQKPGAYISGNQEPGTHGPPTQPGEYPRPKEGPSPFPDMFKGMYDAKGMTPEMIGLTGDRADSFLIHNRSRGNKGVQPFQDYVSEIRSGSGKAVRCVDSPIVDGIVTANEHKGKDYIIFSSSKRGPFSSGELHTRTHGPINTYTLESDIHTWVQDGKNIRIENMSTGLNSPLGDRNGKRTTNVETGSPLSRVGDMNTWTSDQPDTSGWIGNEDYGCVKLWSHHNNLSLVSDANNAVIHIDASGTNSKIVVRTGGTVDIVALKKVTLTSDELVELNAPTIAVNGEAVTLNGSEKVELLSPKNVDIKAGELPTPKPGGAGKVAIKSGRIDLN